MLRRCNLRLARSSPPFATRRIAEPYLSCIRTSSSTPESSRKLPDSHGAARLKSWQRAFLIGVGAGIVAGQLVLYYDRNARSSSFVTYKLVAKEPVSSTASIFHLEPSASSDDFEKYKKAWEQGVWNVQFKQPQIQILRAYTPLPPSAGSDGGKEKQLRFLIRNDPYGEVSSYLHRLPIGADIELRGPNIEYQLTPDVRQIVFFAGGTGIAPALQVAYALFKEEDNSSVGKENTIPKRKLHILWANRRREECLGGVSDKPAAEPLSPKATWSGLFVKQKEKPIVHLGNEKSLVVQELEDLKKRYPGQVTVEYFVNAEDTWIDEHAVFQSLSRFDDKDFSTDSATSSSQRQVLISGPSGFISHLAGPKEWRNGKEEQGNVSKIIAHAIAQNPHHVKVWKI